MSRSAAPESRISSREPEPFIWTQIGCLRPKLTHALDDHQTGRKRYDRRERCKSKKHCHLTLPCSSRKSHPYIRHIRRPMPKGYKTNVNQPIRAHADVLENEILLC